MKVENHKYTLYPTTLKLFSLHLGKGYGCIKKIHLNKMLSGAVKILPLLLTQCLPFFTQWSFSFVIPLQNTSELMPYVVIALLLVCLPIILLFALLSCFCLIYFSRPHLPSPLLYLLFLSLLTPTLSSTRLITSPASCSQPLFLISHHAQEWGWTAQQ